MLPAGVRPRQLRVRTLLAGMCLAQADHRPAHLTRVHQALTALGEEFGREKVFETARRIIIDVAREQGKELASRMGGDSLGHFATALEDWKKGDAYRMDVLEQSEEKFSFNVTRCRYAEMYRALGIPEIGAGLRADLRLARQGIAHATALELAAESLDELIRERLDAMMESWGGAILRVLSEREELALFAPLRRLDPDLMAGAQGQGLVHVDSVSVDGVEVPQFVLELFVEKYLRPKYPNIGIDSRFALPARVDAATVGLHKVILTQK